MAMAMAMAASLPKLTTVTIRRSPQLRRRATAFSPSAKFQLSEVLGGRGLCGGEQGLEKELNKAIPPSPPVSEKPKPPSTDDDDDNDDAAFEKELLGLTGGFPGGEKGLQKFIDENPPPSKTDNLLPGSGSSRPKPPELPLFMPGMIVIVKNPANPYHMYTGIVQRVTDGKAGVLFEGGNWDKLLTFQLHELQRRDKGPPMVNPKSALLESTDA